MSKEVFKMIVKKVVDKVLSVIKLYQVFIIEEKVEVYMMIVRLKILKFVQVC